jgi:CRISPR-associated endonuclease/helicase Cas3
MTTEFGLIFKYWGKAKKSDQQGGDEYHLLPYHCLDVAACGWVLMSDDYPWCKRLAAELEISTAQLRRIFVFFLCVHDIGKFARSFQGQVPEVLKSTGLSADGYRYTVRHDSLGYQLWRDRFQGIQVLLAELLGISPDKVRTNAQLNSWFEIVTGHHGQPPLIEPIHLADHFHADDKSAVQAFISWAWQFWLQSEDIDFLLDKAAGKKLKSCSWRFAGLAVLADWQGSNQAFFKYRSTEMDLQDYWEQWALPKAVEAVAMAGLKPFAVAPFAGIQQLFPFITNPTPLQQYAISMPLGCEPQLFILEDVTGAGKTEAAMVLLHRLMSHGLASGLFVGLPTMATANGMYQRMTQCYQRLFGAGQQPSLVLAHGARQLSDDFMKSVSGQALDADYAEDEQSASAYCNSWIADSRKKSLLADIGVGTIDQALLGILPSRHQSLRLLGLDGKVLLVDEVHAYDPYMQSLLACLLEAHAAQGGSAILLSATLPQQMKNRLVASYAKGRGLSKPLLSNSAYPLLTRFPATTGQQEIELETRREVRRQVQVSRLDDEASVDNLILEAVKAGKCVCWIRNTVKVARNSFQLLVKQLEQQGVDVTRVHLFHSRFAMADRQTIEDNVTTWFGKDSTEQQRYGRVLISTQVVEQSLDLDFDVLISDLAPVDLLLQRAGRLHRHVRDERGNRLKEDGALDQRGAAVFYVLSPFPEVNANAGWLNSQKGSVAVYQDLGQLWRSAKVLFDSGSYRMPDDARHLIESVYSPETSIVTPEAVEQASSEAEGKRRSQASMGNFNQLKLDAGYSRKSSDAWGEEINIPTRLSDQTVSVVLVKQTEGGQWRPYADQQKHGWELSALQMRMELWEKAEKTIPQDLRTAMDSLRAEIPVLKWYALMPLVGDLKEWYDADCGWMENKGDAR